MQEITNINTMSSLEVAQITGKRHSDVLRDIKDEIEKLENQGIITERIFVLSEYTDKTGRRLPMYILTKEGVLQLAARYDAVVRFKLIERVTKPLTGAAYLLQQAQLIYDLDQRTNVLEKDVTRLENIVRRGTTSTQLTVIAYANMKGIKPNQYHSPTIGRKATKICKERGLLIGTVVDSRYGLINTYPQEILDEIFFG